MIKKTSTKQIKLDQINDNIKLNKNQIKLNKQKINNTLLQCAEII